MDEKSMLDHINELVGEEKTLRANHHGLSSDDRTRLEQVQYQLDQCWDMLRQRRARAEFGEDTEDVKERSVNEVEGYLQ